MTSEQDYTSWKLPPGSGVATLSKWKWLWRQFLCVIGLSKKPYVLIGIDTATGEDFCVKTYAKINDEGNLEIVRIEAA